MTELRDIEAERMYLGAVWHSAGRVLTDADLTVDDFQHWPHRRLFTAFDDMWGDGAPFDVATIGQRLGPDLPRIGEALTEVVTSGAVPQSAGWHANVLMRLSAHRRAVEAATRIAQAATGHMDSDDLAEFARGEIDKATAPRGEQPIDSWAQHLNRAVDRWQTPVTDAIPTGWHELDEMLSGGGLRPGHLTVIGARPGVGKSLVATMLAGHTAAGGHGVYFGSVEMSADELTDRIAAAATGVNLADLTNRRLTAEQVEQMKRGLARLQRWNLTIDDRVQTVAHIKRGVRNATRTGLGLVVVDYLQLLSSPDAGKVSRQEVVSGMSRAMKLLAREHNVPVVLLAQLNRESTKRENKQPAVHDLRESGAVEQDSDEIILLHRDDDDPDLAGQIQLHLAKNRHGPTGYVRLHWQPYISRISNPSSYGSAA
ncbi:MAG: replicative DNA helicase [Blastococcus sp.]